MKLFIIIASLICFSITCRAQQIGANLMPATQTVSISNSARFLLLDSQSVGKASYYMVGSFDISQSMVLFGRKLGIFPDALTIASLSYANSRYFNKFQGNIGVNDPASPSVHIPNSPFLRGLTMYFVGITWNPFRTNRLHVSNVSVVITQ